MSKKSGDKARFGRRQQKKLLNRKRTQELRDAMTAAARKNVGVTEEQTSAK